MAYDKTIPSNSTAGNDSAKYAQEHSKSLPQKVLDYYASASEHPRSVLLIPPSEAQYLMWLAKALGVKRILEIGTFIGCSAMIWSEAVGPDGAVTTLEYVQEYADEAKESWSKYGVKNVEVMVGNASDSLKKLVEAQVEPFDLVFIDADKSNYPLYPDFLLQHSQPDAVHRLVRPGGIIIGDNVLRYGLVADSTDANPYTAILHERVMNGEWPVTDLEQLRKFNKMIRRVRD